MQKKIIILLIALALISLVGCNSLTPTTTQTSSTPGGSEEALPAIPTPASSELATVTGVLKQDETNPTPASNAILYLGEIILSDTGTPIVARFNRTTSVSTQTDENGRFIFTDIKPGTYVLVMDLVSDSFMLSDPDTGNDMFITVEGGKVNDLGELVYTELPIQ